MGLSFPTIKMAADAMNIRNHRIGGLDAITHPFDRLHAAWVIGAPLGNTVGIGHTALDKCEFFAFLVGDLGYRAE
jgi:hypothetical protein